MTPSGPSSGDADHGSVDAHLKPGGDGLADDLVEFERSAEAERLARLAADQDLVSTLQWCNFDRTTPEWQKLAEALVEYGYSVFMGWLIKGEVYQRARDRRVRGLKRLPEALRLQRDDAHGLAAELMIVSVEAFRVNVLIRNVWRSSGGASLKTFYIGQSLFQLPDAYQRWARQEKMGIAVEVSDPTQRLRREQELDPAKKVGDRLAVTTLLSRISDSKARAMFDLLSQDYTYDAIAEALDTTEAAVRTRVSRVRKQLQESLR